MLLSPFASPRRLIVLAVFAFLTILVLIRNTSYSSYLPKHDFIPDLSHAPVPAGTKQAEPWGQDASSGNRIIEEDGKAAADGKDDVWDAWTPEVEFEKAKAAEAEAAAATSTSLAENVEVYPIVATPVTGGFEVEIQTVAPSPPPDSPPSSDTVDDASPLAKALSDTITPIAHPSHDETQQKILSFIQWQRPNAPDHWPGYKDYVTADYDPNRWEGLPWDNAYYTHNGVDELKGKPEIYLPYPKYNSDAWKRQWTGKYVACEGARGKNLNESVDDMVKAYHGLPAGFPETTVNNAAILGIDNSSCFDRNSRYGPYGAQEQETNEKEQDPTRRVMPVDWSSVWWGRLQNECLQRNQERYDPAARAPVQMKPQRTLPKDHEKYIERNVVQGDTPKHHSRTAILIRAYEGYSYTDNDLQSIRALVTELSLLSGGEYQVYVFVNVKEREADIYSNPHVYQEVLRRVVPSELRDMAVLWTERVLEEWYPKVGDWQVYWMQFMSLQWFSKTHPEFDYVWNWETDARYIGNHYHFLEQVTAFARSMPRKHLWERNSRFYFPSVHGNFASYLADTDAVIANATRAGTMTPVWGPQPYSPTQTPVGPVPPTSQAEDRFSWGVDEEADLITLQPIWDPSETEWSYRHKIWNYVPGVRPEFTAEDPVAAGFYRPEYTKLPRRVFINTLARFSKKMLHAMHYENLAGRAMQAEMWPATVALQHGLKAVYAPHPIWADRQWADESWYLDAIFNADRGKTARWGQEIDSPYNHDREANFRGWSWYYATSFPGVLYRRWLGWKAQDGGVGELGGKEYEEQTRYIDGVGKVGGHGRMCLPNMLLHPVKNVREDA